MGKVRKTKKNKRFNRNTRVKKKHLKRFKRVSKKARKTRHGGEKRKRKTLVEYNKKKIKNIPGPGLPLPPPAAAAPPPAAAAPPPAAAAPPPAAAAPPPAAAAPPPAAAAPPPAAAAPPPAAAESDSFLNIRRNRGFPGILNEEAYPKRMVSLDTSEELHLPYSAENDDTYVIHAHGKALTSSGLKLDLPPNVKIFSPVTCLGKSLKYNKAHIDSDKMIGASCPGERIETDRYVLTHYEDMPDMEFTGEMSPSAQTSQHVAGIIDGEKINFVAGVYKCIDKNQFYKKPVLRIRPKFRYLLSTIIEEILKHSEQEKTINIIISTCLTYE